MTSLRGYDNSNYNSQVTEFEEVCLQARAEDGKLWCRCVLWSVCPVIFVVNNLKMLIIANVACYWYYVLCRCRCCFKMPSYTESHQGPIFKSSQHYLQFFPQVLP